MIFFLQDGQCQADVVMKRFIDFIKSKDQHRFRRTVGILGELNTSEPNFEFHIQETMPKCPLLYSL